MGGRTDVAHSARTEGDAQRTSEIALEMTNFSRVGGQSSRGRKLCLGAAMDRSQVLTAVATAAGVAAVRVASALFKRRKVPDEVEVKLPDKIALEEPPVVAEEEERFSLLDELLQSDAFYDVIRLMPARSAARLAKVNKMAREIVLAPDIARFCAESRKRMLKRRAVPGDLPLAFAEGECTWTLERLHLCEHPPRFPKILFRFASEAIDDGTGPSSKIAQVARLLRQRESVH